MASVAEVKAALASARESVQEATVALNAVSEKVKEAQSSFMAATEGSGSELASQVQTSLGDLDNRNEDSMTIALHIIESCDTYAASL